MLSMGIPIHMYVYVWDVHHPIPIQVQPAGLYTYLAQPTQWACNIVKYAPNSVSYLELSMGIGRRQYVIPYEHSPQGCAYIGRTARIMGVRIIRTQYARRAHYARRAQEAIKKIPPMGLFSEKKYPLLGVFWASRSSQSSTYVHLFFDSIKKIPPIASNF